MMRIATLIFLLTVAFLGRADEIAPERREALEALVASQELGAVWSSRLDDIVRRLPQDIVAGARNGAARRTDLDEQAKAHLVAAIQSVANDMAIDAAAEIRGIDVERLIRRIVYEAYAPRFSTQELQQLAAFYSSPAGNKYLRIRLMERNATPESLLRHFTPAELDEIGAFTQSPAGRKAQDPTLERDSMQVVESEVGPIIEKILAKYRPRLREASKTVR